MLLASVPHLPQSIMGIIIALNRDVIKINATTLDMWLYVSSILYKSFMIAITLNLNSAEDKKFVNVRTELELSVLLYL